MRLPRQMPARMKGRVVAYASRILLYHCGFQGIFEVHTCPSDSLISSSSASQGRRRMMKIQDVGPVGGQADIARGPSLPKRFQKDARRTRRARLVLVRASQSIAESTCTLYLQRIVVPLLRRTHLTAQHESFAPPDNVQHSPYQLLVG